jgi:predicted lactoylglutathione lyase/uncharacterized protein YndB with AHSA1/START domain
MSRVAEADKEIVIKRVFDAPRKLVWQAWTESAHIVKWWGPRGFNTRVVENDLRSGGTTRYVMTGPDGAEYPVSGVIRELVPFERIVTTDEFDEPYPGVDLPKGIILTILFDELSETKTRLTLRIAHPSAEEKEKHAAMGVVGGWNSSFGRLDEHLGTLCPTHETSTATQIFVNLPVADLERAKGFYTALGHRINPAYTDATGACIVVSDTIYVMLLTHAKFREFTPKPISDATQQTEVLLCLSCPTREALEQMVRTATTAGGSTHAEPKDYGFMYQHGFADPDGHIWELVHMTGAPAA